jgi:hypothetical protein
MGIRPGFGISELDEGIGTPIARGRQSSHGNEETDRNALC